MPRQTAFTAIAAAAITLAATAFALPADAATTPAAPGTVGVDVSGYQAEVALPARAGFGVVAASGVNFGAANPDFDRQWEWASHLAGAPQLYVAAANVVNGTYWNKGGPKPCTGTRGPNCSYDYGWVGARTLVQAARAHGLPRGTRVQWWIDVENSSTWDDGHPALNAAAVRGIRDGLLGSGSASSVGIYTLGADWRTLIGPAPDLDLLPVWAVGGAQATTTNAKGVCTRTSPTGGPIVQGQSRSGVVGRLDVDVVCPVRPARAATVTAKGTAVLTGSALPGTVVRLTVVQGKSRPTIATTTNRFGVWRVTVRGLRARVGGSVQVSRSTQRITLR